MIRADWRHDGTGSRGQNALSPPGGRGIDSVMLNERGILQVRATGLSDRHSGNKDAASIPSGRSGTDLPRVWFEHQESQNLRR
jgi:hypothetical protein